MTVATESVPTEIPEAPVVAEKEPELSDATLETPIPGPDADDDDEGGMPGDDAEAPDMSKLMEMMQGLKGGGKGGGKGGEPDMSQLMSMLGGGGGGMGGMPGMGGGMGGMGGGMGGMGGGMGGMPGMGMPGMGGGGAQQPPADEGEKDTGEGYSWEQKNEEVQVRLHKDGAQKGVEATKKNVKVTFKRFSMTVAIGGETVLDGKLSGGIDVDECCWSIDPDTKSLQIMLIKQDEKKVWDSIFE